MALQNSYVAMIFKTEQAFHQGVKGKASEAWEKHLLRFCGTSWHLSRI